ncbi:hypothetical protein I2I05_19645 [Hymenobacter sp. BT683]|uniref:Uncharacterized protein n=1 Tax=Hymenobacter jeongseonensis TaxID=2791027 RepID=A0ABS0IMP6_9BACT|nr:hypothetical protein [Hymenobacter jeongseonensis]MBF9239616.1 hypothetical protein [Hymenobacter jeongseonensis]
MSHNTGRYWGGAALGAYGPVETGLLLNAIALSLVLARLLDVEWALDKHPVAFVALAGGVQVGAFWYYNRRSWRILNRYQDAEWVNRLPLVLVVMTYYALSFGLALLCALYRNHNGVFK